MKAVALLSGGLDSILAVKLMLEQGIDVVALNFKSPFCLCNQKGKCYSALVAEKFNIPLKVIFKGDEYLKIVKNPKHGHGRGMNPCIDCRIFILTKAKEYAEEIGAKFIFTGEVLNERPMSQHEGALKIIEKESGLNGKILRPLSAKLMPETDAEKKGWVDREKLLDINGRSRKPQIALAKDYGIADYPCPAGGCLLTEKLFVEKVRDFFKHNGKATVRDMEILKQGRHFRVNDNKIIVGRKESENDALEKLKYDDDYQFEVMGMGSPITILQGEKTEDAIKKAAELTARYSDAKDGKVEVSYEDKTITVSKPLSFDEKEFII